MLLKDVPFESGEIEKKLSAIESAIRMSAMEISIANKRIKKETETIGILQNEITEQKIKYLVESGWQKFVFIAKDNQDQRMNSYLEVTFLFKKGILKSKFKKMNFICYFGRGFTMKFSTASASFKNDEFIEFEKWIRSLKDDDYIIVKDILF